MPESNLVLGATGLIGGETARLLLAAGRPVRVLVRHPERAAGLAAAGAEVVVGDLADPPSLTAALRGVTAALLVSSQSPEQVRLQGNFVRAAATAGGVHLVKVSGFLTSLDSSSQSGRWHARTEADIDAAGLTRTFLRAPFFLQNLLRTRPHALDSGELAVPIDPSARIAMVDARDIAAVAAAALGDAAQAGRALLVTGPEALSFPEVAQRLTRATGRPIAFRRLSPEQTRARLEEAGAPPWRVEVVLEFFAGFSRNLGATLSDAVREVTGRDPRRLEDYVADHRPAFETPGGGGSA